jgi:hypothetical protein
MIPGRHARGGWAVPGRATGLREIAWPAPDPPTDAWRVAWSTCRRRGRPGGDQALEVAE